MFTFSKPTELWRQLPDEPDLWHGENGVILNSAALLEREFYFDIVRSPSTNFGNSQEVLTHAPA